MRQFLLRVVPLVATTSLSCACDNTAEECASIEKIVGTEDTALEESKIAEYKEEPARSAELAERHAEAMKRQASALKGLSLTNPRLQRRVADYVKAAAEAGTAASKLSAAYQGLVSPRQRALSKRKAWRQAGDALKQGCEEESATCEVISKLPSPETGDDPLADELDKYATRLEEMTVDEEALQEPIRRRIVAAREHAEAQRALSAEEAKVDMIGSTFYQAATTSDAALQRLRADCAEVE